MDGSSAVGRGLSESDRARFAAVREKAEKLGVLDINFGNVDSSKTLECYERTLEIIEENKEFLDRNAGEAQA
ncbi:MAG: hypothetical protein FWG66_03780 [Spirochaetes bacterium]|nr:hypothetical protein [Spirochaetota bacterium]